MKPPEKISISKNNLNIIHKEIKNFTLKIVDSIIKFYKIELKGKYDNRSGLFENTVTNMIIKNNLYYIFLTFHKENLKNKLKMLKDI